MNNQSLPIFKSSLDMAVYIEKIVENFDRYSKYNIGQDMRKMSQQLLFLVNRTICSPKENKQEKITELISHCEDMKTLLYLAKELKLFKSFKQFEHSSKLSVDICRQANAWLKNSVRIQK